MWGEERHARNGIAAHLGHEAALRSVLRADDREMTAAFEAIDLEDDGITRRAFQLHLRLGAERTAWPARFGYDEHGCSSRETRDRVERITSYCW